MPRITVLGPAPAPSRGKPARAAARWPHYQKYDVEVAPSPIDGQGVFAAEPIAAGVKIGEIRGEPLRIDEARIRATRYERVMMVEVSSKRAQENYAKQLSDFSAQAKQIVEAAQEQANQMRADAAAAVSNAKVAAAKASKSAESAREAEAEASAAVSAKQQELDDLEVKIEQAKQTIQKLLTG